MPCLIVIHGIGNAVWNTDDIVQVFPARKREGRVEALIGNVWMTDLGREGSRQFLALWIPNATVAFARPFEGLGKGRVAWRAHFSASEQNRILDPGITMEFQEKPGIARDILKVGPG